MALNKICMIVSPEESVYDEVPFGLASFILFSSGFSPLLEEFKKLRNH